MNQATATNEYQTALESFRAVAIAHREAAKQYRARIIGDNEFLASADKLKKEGIKFDAAEINYVAISSDNA